MTQRAMRAAEVLRRRGWQMDSDDSVYRLDKGCVACGHLMPADSRYCPQCGTPVLDGFASSSLEDIEAAICAAVDGEQQEQK